MAEAIVAVAGLALSAFGLWESSEAGDKQDEMYRQQAELSKKQSAEMAAAERAREKQMQIAARRERMKMIREHSVMAALGKSRGVAAGGSAAEGMQSSGYAGGQAQLASQLGEGLGTSFATERLGTDIFTANQNQYALGAQSASIGSQANLLQRDIDWGQTLFGLGSAVTQGAEKTANNFNSAKTSLFGA
jgi:hypothetical protein